MMDTLYPLQNISNGIDNLGLRDEMLDFFGVITTDYIHLFRGGSTNVCGIHMISLKVNSLALKTCDKTAMCKAFAFVESIHT